MTRAKQTSFQAVLPYAGFSPTDYTCALMTLVNLWVGESAGCIELSMGSDQQVEAVRDGRWLFSGVSVSVNE